jgi:hypothetical protein
VDRAASGQAAGPGGATASATDAEVEAEDDEDEDDEGAPEEFFCPITLELMRDPVFATDGHSYERAAITEWLLSHARSPKTGAPLENPMLIPNHVLRGQLIAWRERRKADRAAELAAEGETASDGPAVEETASAGPAAPLMPAGYEPAGSEGMAVAVAPPPL